MRTVILASVLLYGCGGLATQDNIFTTDASFNGPTNTCSGPTNVWEHVPGYPVLTSPEVHFIFWGNYWINSTAGQQEFQSQTSEWNTLYNDPYFFYPVSQYGIGSGRLAGTILSNWNVPNGSLSEIYIQGELNNEIQNGTLPSGNSQTIYMILLPPDSQSAYDISNKFTGHHSYTNGFTYAVVEYNSNTTFVVAHETYEASTNPNDSSGWWGNGGETEVADVCQGVGTWTLDGYTLPTIWNQKDCKCEP